MEHDHRFPIVATFADGDVFKPLHMTVGPGLDDVGEVDPDAEQVTILWRWSAAVGRAYAWVTTENRPIPVPGRSDRWTLDTSDGQLQLRYSRSASCCGDPMKRWRPPGVGASRRSASA
jgi:hypothetical protein